MSDTKALAAQIRANINKRMNKEVARNLSSTEELLQVEYWIPMLPFFQNACGGQGFPCGHITQVVGESDTGKTTLVMEGMISAQKNGGLVYLLDSEHKFDFNRFRLMGGVPESVDTITVESLEEGWNAIQAIAAEVFEARKKFPDLLIMVVWDSLAASVPDSLLEAEAENSHVAVDAKINNKEIRKIRQLVRKTNIAAVFINHTYWTMPKFGISKEVLKGGAEMFYMSTLILKTKRKSWLQREVGGLVQKYGTCSLLEVFKGHLGGRKTQTQFYIVDRGIIDDEKTLAEYKAALSAESKIRKSLKKGSKEEPPGNDEESDEE